MTGIEWRAGWTICVCLLIVAGCPSPAVDPGADDSTAGRDGVFDFTSADDREEQDTDGDGFSDAVEQLVLLTDSTIPNEVIPIARVFCDNALQLAAPDLGVMYDSTARSPFAEWAAGDLVVVEVGSIETGVYYIVNLRTEQGTIVVDHGELIRESRIATVANDFSAVELLNGEVWRAHGDFATEFMFWHINDPVIITSKVIGFTDESFPFRHMINLRTCEDVLLSPF